MAAQGSTSRRRRFRLLRRAPATGSSCASTGGSISRRWVTVHAALAAQKMLCFPEASVLEGTTQRQRLARQHRRQHCTGGACRRLPSLCNYNTVCLSKQPCPCICAPAALARVSAAGHAEPTSKPTSYKLSILLLRTARSCSQSAGRRTLTRWCLTKCNFCSSMRLRDTHRHLSISASTDSAKLALRASSIVCHARGPALKTV